jgi:hypothetical protein
MNRYWFSQKQKELRERIITEYGRRKAEVLTAEGWREYTQWCTRGEKSPWEDAVLVAESENELPIRIDGHVQGYGGIHKQSRPPSRGTRR